MSVVHQEGIGTRWGSQYWSGGEDFWDGGRKYVGWERRGAFRGAQSISKVRKRRLKGYNWNRLGKGPRRKADRGKGGGKRVV